MGELRLRIHLDRHLAVVPSGIFVEELERHVLVSLATTVEGTSVPFGTMTRSGAKLPWP